MAFNLFIPVGWCDPITDPLGPHWGPDPKAEGHHYNQMQDPFASLALVSFRNIKAVHLMIMTYATREIDTGPSLMNFYLLTFFD